MDTKVYLLDAKDGYPLGPYSDVAIAEKVREGEGRIGQSIAHMTGSAADEIRRRLLRPTTTNKEKAMSDPDGIPPVLEAWEDCERDYSVPHGWRWANFQNFQLGGQECDRCPATRVVTDWVTLDAVRDEIRLLGGSVPALPANKEN